MKELMCKVFKCIKTVGDEKWLFMKEGDIFVETFFESGIFRPERISPGNTGIELNVFKDHNIDKFLKPLPSVAMHETTNFKYFYKDAFLYELAKLEKDIKTKQKRVDRLKIMLGKNN